RALHVIQPARRRPAVSRRSDLEVRRDQRIAVFGEIELGPLRADIRDIQDEGAWQFALNAERPSLVVRVDQIWIGQRLRVARRERARRRRYQGRQPWQAARVLSADRRSDERRDQVRRGGRRVRGDVVEERIVADLVATADDRLARAEKPTERSAGECRRVGDADGRGEAVVIVSQLVRLIEWTGQAHWI